MNNKVIDNQNIIVDYDQACIAVKSDPFNYDNLESSLQNDQNIIEITLISIYNKLSLIELSHMYKLTRQDKILNNVKGLRKLAKKLEDKQVVPKLK